MIPKWLAIGIILLFVGVTIASSNSTEYREISINIKRELVVCWWEWTWELYTDSGCD